MMLTEQQKEIVNYNKLGTLIVKGTAGSGKSLVGLHRINYLFEKTKYSLIKNQEKCKFLVITFNKVMFYHLKELFEKIKDNNINSNDVEFINIDKIMFREALKTAKELNYSIVMNDFEIKLMINSMNSKRTIFPNDFILDEIKWIQSNILVKKDDYLNINRTGRGRRKLNKEDREYIWDILEKYRKKMISQRKIDYLDACILALKKSNFSIFSDYNHIIVDEAQDLNKLKLMFITKLNKNNLIKPINSLMILYDSSQNVYDESWLGYGRSFASIGLDVKNKIKKLETSYRTTRQIHQAANNLILHYKEANIDTETELQPLFAGTEEGIKPISFKFINKDDEYQTYSNIIKKITERAYKYSDIMMVGFTKKHLEEMQKFLLEQRIPSYILDGDTVEKQNIKFNDNKVKLLTINNAKGLESKVVFILSINTLNYVPNNEEKDEEELHIRNGKKIYTAMTRAQELLFMGEDEKYICNIDEKYLTKISDYKDLDIDSYLAAGLNQNKIYIDTNTTDRFKTIKAECERQAEEQEQIVIKNDAKMEKAMNNLLHLFNKNEILDKIKIEFKELFEEEINNILKAEIMYQLFKNELVDESFAYSAYSKIVELRMRRFIISLNRNYPDKMTLGTLMVIFERDFPQVKPICLELRNINFLNNRNNATHDYLEDSKQVDIIKKYLITDKGVLKLEKILKNMITTDNTNNNLEIKKEGKILGRLVIYLNNQRYISYCLNNKGNVLCKDELSQNEKYSFIGYKLKNGGLEYYIVKSYKKL